MNCTHREGIPRRPPAVLPRNARSRRTRLALLAAARSLLEEHGFEALTMAAVAERAGVSRRAVYLHFASRTELVTALFGYVNEAEDLAASLHPVLDAPDSVAALDEWARHLARYHPRLLAHGRAFARVRDSDPDAAELWSMVTADWRSICRKLAGRLHREDRLAPGWTVATAADMLWALMSFDVLEGLLVECGWSRRRYAERMSALLCATFVRADVAADVTTPDVKADARRTSSRRAGSPAPARRAR
jgi:AcrR family transcriptional regulator